MPSLPELVLHSFLHLLKKKCLNYLRLNEDIDMSWRLVFKGILSVLEWRFGLLKLWVVNEGNMEYCILLAPTFSYLITKRFNNVFFLFFCFLPLAYCPAVHFLIASHKTAHTLHTLLSTTVASVSRQSALIVLCSVMLVLFLWNSDIFLLFLCFPSFQICIRN